MDLPLKHVMIVNKSTISVVRAVIIELEQDGLRGYGEAYESPSFNIFVEDMVTRLEKCQPDIQKYALADPIAFGRHFEPWFDGFPAAKAALEMAACDLWGKLRNLPLWKIWGLNPQNIPLSSYTLTLDSVFRMLQKYEECPNWPIYRVLCGGFDDMEVLRQLRKRTDAVFRLDMCGTWTLKKMLDRMDELQQLNIELIEQPLPREDWKSMAILKEKCPIPLFADESCRSDADLERCAQYFDGVNLQPVKFGGLYTTADTIAKAKHLGLKTMIGNTIESSVGASAMAQFAPSLDYIYLDGPQLINKRIGQGVQLNQGKITFPSENGTGIRFSYRS